MAVEFEISDRAIDPRTRVIAVSGEVDLFSAPQFKQYISAAIEAGAERVVVDLTGAVFIDSSSLGVLIGAQRRLKERGGSVVVVCDDDAIVKTFTITGLDGVFGLVPSLADALDSDAVGA